MNHTSPQHAGGEGRDHIDRALLPFAPLLYIAWADGELSAEEAALLRRRVDEAGVDARIGDALAQWLEPSHPPTPDVLEALLLDVRRAASHLERGEHLSIATLARAIGRAEGVVIDEQTLRAVRAVEEALGLPDSESARAILGDALAQPSPAADALSTATAPAAVEAIAQVLGGSQRALRSRVLQRLAQPDFTHIQPGTPTAERREHVLAWCRTLAGEGFPAIGYPREFGGQHDLEASFAAYRAIANHDLSLFTKYGVQFGLFAGSIYQLGTRSHHERYLRQALTLELSGCFAMTETAHGSNVRDIETTARYDADTDEFVVDTPHERARKDYIGNAAVHGRIATVFAQLETAGGRHGVHALVVPIRDEAGNPLPGVRIEDCGEKQGLNGIDNGRLYFDGVRVPRENLLDRFGSVNADGVYSSPIASPGRRFFTMLGTLVAGRIAVAGAAASAAQTALTIGVRYAAQRRQFGPEGAAEVPILDYLSVQRRLLPRLATTYAIEFGFHDLTRRFAMQDEEAAREVEALAAGLKAYASDHAVAAIQDAREVCGGQGYMAENRLPQLRADTDVFTTFEGANAVLYQLVARSLLGSYRAQFGELRPLGIARYLAGRAAAAVALRNPIATRRTDEEHLRDPDVQTAAMEYREQRLLASLARRLKARIDDGMDAFLALNECQDHAIHLARAHVERMLLEQFVAATGEADAAGLEPVRSLFALAAIERDAAWFLEAGYLEPVKARAVRATVNRLCALTRPRALELVDAFGLPPAVIAAPIAFSVP